MNCGDFLHENDPIVGYIGGIQAREMEQESGTQMRGIMSGRGFVDYS